MHKGRGEWDKVGSERLRFLCYKISFSSSHALNSVVNVVHHNRLREPPKLALYTPICLVHRIISKLEAKSYMPMYQTFWARVLRTNVSKRRVQIEVLWEHIIQLVLVHLHGLGHSRTIEGAQKEERERGGSEGRPPNLGYLYL